MTYFTATAAASSPRMEMICEPRLVNTPDRTTTFLHFLDSTTLERGFRAAICLDKQPLIPANLGLPKMDSYADTVFLQLAQRGEMFLRYDDPNARTLQINFKEYIGLLHFFRNEWPAIESKLFSQARQMRSTEDPIYINPHLVFHHHGSTEYEAKLGSRLLFKARIDSKDPVHDRIHVWLEMLDGGGSIELPFRVMAELACGSNTIHFLATLREKYKGSSRKRSQPV
jgi:hypothetical protein